MQKKVRNSHVKKIAFSEIFILVLATVAFAFVLNETSLTSAATLDGKTFGPGDPLFIENSGNYWKTDGISLWKGAMVNGQKTWEFAKAYAPSDFTGSKIITSKIDPFNLPGATSTLGPGPFEYNPAVGGSSPPPSITESPGSNLKNTGGTQTVASLALLQASGPLPKALSVAMQAGPIAQGVAITTPDGMRSIGNLYGSVSGGYFFESEGKISEVSSFAYKATNEGAASLKQVATVSGGKIVPGTVTPSIPPTFGANLWEGIKTGFWHAVMVYGLVKLIAPAAGLDKAQTNAVANALSAGTMAWDITAKVSPKILGETLGAWGPFIIGAAVALVILMLSWKDTKRKMITFTCMPWQAPRGGDNCNQCNGDENKPCSEYRCKALGLQCALLNKETPGKEMCAKNSTSDTLSPEIRMNNETLSPQTDDVRLRYVNDPSVRPPALGVQIVRGVDSCIPAFTALQFGIKTDEPSLCKLDYNLSATTKLEQMQFYFGDSYYALEHTLRMRLPGLDTFAENNSPVFKNDGTTQLFVKCMDMNENENVDEYSIKFCVDASPDTTPPIVEGASPLPGSFIRYQASNSSVELHLNEPANCSWSLRNEEYKLMANKMECSDTPKFVNGMSTFVCNTNVTGIEDNKENKYFFRCMDRSVNNNTMTQSWPVDGYILKGSRPLDITKVGPNETITGSTDPVKIDLEVETANGAEDGKANCSFSDSGIAGTYVPMFETNSYSHKQPGLQLKASTAPYTYYFFCRDAGNNGVNATTSFIAFADKTAPQIIRAYRDGADAIRLVTNEDAECVYALSDCNFEFESGLPAPHSSESIKTNSYLTWKPNTKYYVKCRDNYGNDPSSGCTAIIQPVENIRTSS